MATLNDVAQKAGVTATTASRVMNNMPSLVPISDETCRKVRRAADELKYYPNYFARSLRTKTSKVIGVVVADVTDSFFGEIISGMEKVLDSEGYSFLLSSIQNSTRGDGKHLEKLSRIGVDGLLLAGAMPGTIDEEIGSLSQQKIPMTLIGGRSALAVPSVTVDNFTGGRLVTEHLISGGRTSVVHITATLPRADVTERLEGCKAAMAAHALDGRLRVEVGDGSIESGYQIALRVLRDIVPPAAFFAYNDFVAIGVIRALSSLGTFRIPEDIAVAGFDDIPIAAHYQPSLTSVRQPRAEMGKTGAELLLKMLRGQVIENRDIVFVPELLVRSSSKSVG